MGKLKSLLHDKNMAIVFAMGFASGFPLLLSGTTIQAWFATSGVSLLQIGLFTMVGVPYTLKFLWSPIFDRFVPPFFGRRRGWMAITQVGLMIALVGFAFCDPKVSTLPIAILALSVSFISATQDIVIDAYRREILPIEALGLGNSLAITGYRLGMIVVGSGALILAGFLPWSSVFLIMAAIMGVGLVTTFLAPEPVVEHAPPRTLREAVFEPFKDFFSRPGALWILAFILLYKVGDNLATALTTKFYVDLGYTVAEIGAIGKGFAIWSTIVGGIIGGVTMLYLGMKRSLWVFGILQGTANLSFAWLATTAPGINEHVAKLAALATAITIENVTAGMGTAAFTAFMASLTNKRFTATQYALLSSLMGVPRVFSGPPASYMISSLGYPLFYVACTLLSIPGLLLLFKIGKWADAHDA